MSCGFAMTDTLYSAVDDVAIETQLFSTHVVNPHALRVDLAKTFGGWHFSVVNGAVSKTALAVVPLYKSREGSTNDAVCQLYDAVNRANVVNVSDPVSMIEKCASFLHNFGMSLQVSAGTMNLLRPLRVLVRGSKHSHVACPCDVKNYYVLTDAFRMVSLYVFNLLTSRASTSANKRDTVSHLVLTITAEDNVTTCESLFKFIEGKNKTIDTSNVSAALHAAAILHTSFNDAGMNFRDRSSKAEAGRKLGQAIEAFLGTKVDNVTT